MRTLVQHQHEQAVVGLNCCMQGAPQPHPQGNRTQTAAPALCLRPKRLQAAITQIPLLPQRQKLVQNPHQPRATATLQATFVMHQPPVRLPSLRFVLFGPVPDSAVSGQCNNYPLACTRKPAKAAGPLGKAIMRLQGKGDYCANAFTRLRIPRCPLAR